ALLIPFIAAYALVFQGGSGRLRLVGLVGCLALVYSASHPRRWHKVAVIVGLPVALKYLAASRLAVQRSLAAPGSLYDNSNSGLASMYAPLQAFSSIIHAQTSGLIPLHWGSSFITPLFVVVPQDLRPSWVPPAFDYALVALTNPTKFDTG